MSTLVTIDESVQGLAVGLMEATGLRLAPADQELQRQCLEAVRQAVSAGPRGGDQRRLAVRGLLRQGGFRPAGRNKPAQEYLWGVARQADRWPVILNLVDILNRISLQSGLPISLVAVERVGAPLVIRYGMPGESFVFNQAGQCLDLEGLICICRQEAEGAIPFGSPVKDSQTAKVTAADSHVLACIFAPRSAVNGDELRDWTRELADGAQKWCGAKQVDTWLMPPAW